MTKMANIENKHWNIAGLLLTMACSLVSAFPDSAFAAFENTGAGARAAALGGAYTAVGDDTWSLLYNPAGLARLKQPEIVSEYSRLYTGLSDGSDLYHYFVGTSVPIKNYGTVALGWDQLGFSSLYKEQSVFMGYGQWITSHLAGGATVKYLRHSFDAPTTSVDDNGNIQAGTPSLFSQNGNSRANVSADLGLLFKISERQHIGFSVQDINEPNMALDKSDTDRVTRTWHLGWAGESARKLTLTADVAENRCSSCRTGDYTGTGGIEKWWKAARFGELAARGALSVGSREFQELSTGFGYRWKMLNVDYAFVFNLSGVTLGDSAGTHRFSLAYRFGLKKDDMVNLVKAKFPEENEFPLSVLKGPEDYSDGLAMQLILPNGGNHP